MFGATLGQNQPTGGGLFGSSLNTNQPSGGSGLFGGLGQNNQQAQNQQQPGGGLFGGLGQNNQQPQNQQTSGLFGGLGQNNPQNQPQQTGGTGLFSNLGQSAQQNPQQQTGGLFGGISQTNQQNQQTGGFGLGQNNQGTGIFGGSIQQPQNGIFSQPTQQQGLPQLGQSGSALWQPNSGINPREKSVPEQIATVLEKWDTGNPNCAFRHYFYNKVEPSMAPYYRPGPNEDPKAWEEALSKKPGPGFVPVLCTGFAQMGERIKTQQRNLANFNARLHEINIALSTMLQIHDTKTSIRARDAKRQHVVLKQRCLALATKVQVLRNRGYAMDGDEEDLRTKLLSLDRGVNDPGLGARGEEIWARMLTVQERAKLLRSEIEKSGSESLDVLDEDMDRRARKILEDYMVQMDYLKKELNLIHQDYVEWEKEHPAGAKINGK